MWRFTWPYITQAPPKKRTAKAKGDLTIPCFVRETIGKNELMSDLGIMVITTCILVVIINFINIAIRIRCIITVLPRSNAGSASPNTQRPLAPRTYVSPDFSECATLVQSANRLLLAKIGKSRNSFARCQTLFFMTIMTIVMGILKPTIQHPGTKQVKCHWATIQQGPKWHRRNQRIPAPAMLQA